MAKKTQFSFQAITTIDSTEKAAAWLTSFHVISEDGSVIVTKSSAWKNASAAKRWIKAQVLEHTPRKSVKMVPSAVLDEKGKPNMFMGELFYKA